MRRKGTYISSPAHHLVKQELVVHQAVYLSVDILDYRMPQLKSQLLLPCNVDAHVHHCPLDAPQFLKTSHKVSRP